MAREDPIEYIQQQLESGVAYVILPVDLARRLLYEYNKLRCPLDPLDEDTMHNVDMRK